ncbi:MAG: hypothetical protein IT361_01985 [Gemmatimonadaceae bacterium]|nr:hypothetical protein [Gemmatimonadaceae bacterium]
MTRAMLLACAVLTACTTSSVTTSGTLTTPRPRSGATSTFVPIDEIQRFPDASSLFDVLQRTRPAMVRARLGSHVLRGIQPEIDVFINGQYAGATDVLRTLQPRYVSSVRMVQRVQAYTEYGAWLRGEHVLFVTLVR